MQNEKDREAFLEWEELYWGDMKGYPNSWDAWQAALAWERSRVVDDGTVKGLTGTIEHILLYESMGHPEVDATTIAQMLWDEGYLRTAQSIPQAAGWQSIETAPKDGQPILVWHDHTSDTYYQEGENRLTPYGAWCEGFGYEEKTGFYIAVWGGAYEEDESGEGWGPYTIMPDWWFQDDGKFEKPLSPAHWMPLPQLPKPEHVDEAGL